VPNYTGKFQKNQDLGKRNKGRGREREKDKPKAVHPIAPEKGSGNENGQSSEAAQERPTGPQCHLEKNAGEGT